MRKFWHDFIRLCDSKATKEFGKGTPLTREQHVQVAKAALAEMDPAPSGKAWTQTKPDRPGYYWVRSPTNPEARILLFEPGRPEDMGSAFEPASGPHSTVGWQEFAGPIPEPTTPAKPQP